MYGDLTIKVLGTIAQLQLLAMEVPTNMLNSFPCLRLKSKMILMTMADQSDWR